MAQSSPLARWAPRAITVRLAGAKAKHGGRYRVGNISLGWREGVAVANIYDRSTGKRTQSVKLGKFRKNDPAARKALDRFTEQHTAALATPRPTRWASSGRCG